MAKRFNIQGIIILVVVLLAIQLGFGLLVSPALKTVIVDRINAGTGSKVTLESVHLWPLTLSLSMKGLKVFDPEGNERIVSIDKASARLSFWALLSKRVVISYVNVNGAEIDLKREADGNFNVQKLARPAEGEGAPGEAAAKPSIFDRFKGKQDWFGMIYNSIRTRSSKEAARAKEKALLEAKTVKREVVQLPKGKKVVFKKVGEDYLFQVRKLDMKNVKLRMESEDGQVVDVEKAGISLRGLAMDPAKGARFDALSARGDLRKKEAPAGSFSLTYSQSFKHGAARTDFDASAKDVDMTAVDFIYKDSLPVTVNKGILDLKTRTEITDGNINSKNSLKLRDQELAVKSGSQAAVGFMPMPLLVDAMNKVDPMELKFDITGTTDNPQFSGFQDSLKELVKPYIEDVKKQGIKAVGDMLKEKLGMGEGSGSGADEGADATKNAVESIKSLFGGKQ